MRDEDEAFVRGKNLWIATLQQPMPRLQYTSQNNRWAHKTEEDAIRAALQLRQSEIDRLTAENQSLKERLGEILRAK